MRMDDGGSRMAKAGKGERMRMDDGGSRMAF
jgi:hypothetical protein